MKCSTVFSHSRITHGGDAVVQVTWRRASVESGVRAGESLEQPRWAPSWRERDPGAQLLSGPSV